LPRGLCWVKCVIWERLSVSVSWKES
jgi:hypothetical protein